MLSVPSQPIFSAYSALSHQDSVIGVTPSPISSDGHGSTESFLTVLLAAGGPSFANSSKHDGDSNAGRENAGNSQETDEHEPASEVAGGGGLWLLLTTTASAETGMAGTAPDSVADEVDPLLYALEQVQEQLRFEPERPGRFELRLDLTPPELGRVQLYLILEAKQLRVFVRVQNDDVKQYLEERLAELRVRLEAMGLDLTELEIAHDETDDSAQPAHESSTETAKAATRSSPKLRKRFALLTKTVSLVDVIV
jgi:hypothetical protein